MNKQEMHRARMERINIVGTKAQRRKKYKDILKEIGARNITFSNISNDEKMLGLMDVFDQKEGTMDELAALKIMSIVLSGADRDSLKAFEIVRDTVGEKPSNNVELAITKSPLDGMTTEELRELLEMYRDEPTTEDN